MIINNIKIVLLDKIIEKGYLEIENGIIKKIGTEPFLKETSDCFNKEGLICFPGFIDVHMHGACNEDFMETNKEGIKKIASSLYKEGVTTFLATTLTSDEKSLQNACKVIASCKDDIPSLGGIHLEGPYISLKYKGAQNEKYIRNPNIKELENLIKITDNFIKDITLAPELEGSLEFIRYATNNKINVSIGHTDASFNEVEKAITSGARSTTHTHNAMSGHHHRNPGVVTASMYFDSLFTEVICDGIHVCKETVKTFYKIVGPDRFVMITDALKIKHSDEETFKLFGLDCIKKNGAAYLTSGALAGSILTMDKGLRNMQEWTKASLIDLAKISSYNASRLLKLDDRGCIKEKNRADLVLLDNNLNVCETYLLGKKVY